jgi:methylenetetrahydrofolate reductase (NADPH)
LPVLLVQRFREALSQETFVLTAELPLSPKLNRHAIVSMAEKLSLSVTAIQIPDHTNARPHISNLTASALLLQAGIDPIMHMNSRDRNRISLQSDLLSAQALGITSILLMRGMDLPSDHRPRATSIFDVGAIDFITTASAIRDGEALSSARDEHVSPFQIGAIAQVFDPAPDWTPEKLKAKTDAGANFIQLPLCMNLEILTRYMQKLISARLLWKASVMVTIAPFADREAAEKTKASLPDSLIPQSILNQLEQSANPRQTGIDICAEMLTAISKIPGISGANILVDEDVSAAAEVVAAFQAAQPS